MFASIVSVILKGVVTIHLVFFIVSIFEHLFGFRIAPALEHLYESRIAPALEHLYESRIAPALEHLYESRIASTLERLYEFRIASTLERLYESHIASTLERLYESHIAPTLERLAEDFLERRRARTRPPPEAQAPQLPPLSPLSVISVDGFLDSSDQPTSNSLSTLSAQRPHNGQDEGIASTPPSDQNGSDHLQSSTTTARGDLNAGEMVNTNATLRKRLAAAVDKDGDDHDRRLGDEQDRPAEDVKLRQQPSSNIGVCSPSSDVDESKNTVEERRGYGQGQHPLPATSPVPTPPVGLHVLDEPNPLSPLQNLSIHARDIVPAQLLPLRASTITTSASPDASSENTSATGILDTNDCTVATQHAGLDVTQSIAPLQTDSSGDSSWASQFVVSPPNASAFGTLPEFPHTPTRSNQPSSLQSSQPASHRSSPLQGSHTPPYLLTPFAQHPHHVHLSPPPNVAVATSPIVSESIDNTPTAPTHSHPATFPASSPLSNLSQSYSTSLDHEQETDAVSNATLSSPSPFRSPSLKEPFELVSPPPNSISGLPESPGSQASTSSPQSLLIPPSISPFPTLSVLHATGGNGTGDQPPFLVTTTTTTNPQSSTFIPQPPSSSLMSMACSFADDGTARFQTPPPLTAAVQLDGSILSFPAEINQQQLGFASPGDVMSPTLSELDFVSECDGSELGSDIGSDSSWSSDRS